MKSTVSEMENIRHAEERGAILRILSEDFASEMTSTGSLLRTLDMMGYAVSTDGFAVHLRYLQQAEYIQVWRTRDLPGWRADRPSPGSANDARFARLLPRGLQLVDGNIPADPAVRFA